MLMKEADEKIKKISFAIVGLWILLMIGTFAITDPVNTFLVDGSIITLLLAIFAYILQISTVQAVTTTKVTSIETRLVNLEQRFIKE